MLFSSPAICRTAHAQRLERVFVRAEVAYFNDIVSVQDVMEEEIMPVSVTCGSNHTAVITRRGDLISWGMGTSGQTGHGPVTGDVRFSVSSFAR